LQLLGDTVRPANHHCSLCNSLDYYTDVLSANRRNPKQIEQTNGFKSKAITHENTKDPSLYNHCNGDPLDPWYTVDADGYISTSQLFSVAVRYLNGNEKGAIYKIAPHDNLVSCQDALGRRKSMEYQLDIYCAVQN
jgi:hypothetical protein